MLNRPHWHTRYPKGITLVVGVYHGHDIRAHPVYCGVDEAFEITGATAILNRGAIKILFDDVFRCDQRWCYRPSQQKSARIGRVPHAHMTKPIDNALIG